MRLKSKLAATREYGGKGDLFTIELRKTGKPSASESPRN